MIDVLRILLAVVFATAGVAKLADLEGSRRAVAGFGVRDPLARPLGLALPLAELAIAAGLLFTASARYAAAAAAGLLAVYCVAIGTALARGRTPDCHCFGRLHSAPAGGGTLTRNAGLGAVTVAIALIPAATPSWLALAIGAVTAALGAQAALWVVLLRRYGQALRRIDELTAAPIDHEVEPPLGPGDVMPAFVLPRSEGGRQGLDELRGRGLPVMLVLTDERCGSCAALYPVLARWEVEFGDHVTIAVLGLGSAESLTALAQEHGLETVLIADPGTFDTLGVEATPGALVVAPDGRVTAALQYGAVDIEMLLLDTVQLDTLREVAHHG